MKKSHRLLTHTLKAQENLVTGPQVFLTLRSATKPTGDGKRWCWCGVGARSRRHESDEGCLSAVHVSPSMFMLGCILRSGTNIFCRVFSSFAIGCPVNESKSSAGCLDCYSDGPQALFWSIKRPRTTTCDRRASRS